MMISKRFCQPDRTLTPWALERLGWLVILAWLIASGPLALGHFNDDSRHHGIVQFSDGKALCGPIFLTPGREFTLSAMPVPGEDPPDPKTFTLDTLREVSFFPFSPEGASPERLERESRPDPADPKKKLYLGDPRAQRTVACSIRLNNGEQSIGLPGGGAFYVKYKRGSRDVGWGLWQISVSNPQIGAAGQVLDELPYLTHIRLTDKPAKVEAKLDLSLPGFPLGEGDVMASLTSRTLATTPVTRGKQPGNFQVALALEESLLLAARKAGKYLVGWPKQQADQETLLRAVQQQIAVLAGYYQEQNVLGLLSNQTPGEVLALVRLRHKVAQNADPLSGEFDAQGRRREFFCLAVYRFQQDAKTAKLSPLGLGIFFHGPTDSRKPTPDVEITPALWPVVRKGTQVTAGPAQP